MHKIFASIVFILLISTVLNAGQTVVTGSIDDIIEDIYRQLLEDGETDYEELQEELMEFTVNPINLNQTTEEELKQLRFLSMAQIDAILLYAYKHPFESVDELNLIAGLQPYDIRNLRPFVTVKLIKNNNRIPAAEVFRHAKHELTGRMDIRQIEDFEKDPVFTQFKYKFNYANRVQFGFALRREPGTGAKDLRYGAFIQLNDIAPHLKTIVAGNYQASFGQGLVLNTGFHMGKSGYVLTAGNAMEGLKKSTSAIRSTLHGTGITLTFGHITKLKTEVSVLYGLSRSNDSTWKHSIGANLTFKHKQFKIGLTAVENIYSDSLRYYYESAAYNQNYFRGDKQAVIGMNFRYNHGWFDVFGEVAAAQNRQWGTGAEAGCRFTPISDIGLIILYRYYSPTFDNTLGYALSETSRINDEHGVYAGAEIKRLKGWRFAVYGDVFYFSGQKYGITTAPSWGYDAMAQAEWITQKQYSMSWRFRAKQKGQKDVYALRYQFNWQHGGWSLRTQADANLANAKKPSYGISVQQNIQYRFQQVPITIQIRMQGFDVRNWDNRIYNYENDVLYAYSIPATYGVGGRFYVNFRWRIIPALSLYLKVSETVYSKNWSLLRSTFSHSYPQTRTDIHLLLRANI